ncbi:MAG: preprotein translocase subunit SecG [Verrucomicrobiae bacterium]|nr:preprotein translocase subunit SecG [Verrucomicrobiae bacterium]
MGLFIGFLTGILVLDCLLLVLLVLVQLPKKEAGAGLAFGGGAADALFGAGAGNPLTKITKYSAVAFFVLLLAISLLQRGHYNTDADSFRSAIEQENQQAAAATTSAAATAPTVDASLLTATNVPVPTVDTNVAPK